MQIDWTFAKDIVLPLLTIILPIISAAVAAVISYRRGRTSVFREKIYDKQIEGYPQLLDVAFRARKAITSLRSIDAPYSEDEIKKWREDADRILDECYHFIYTQAIFFPKDIMEEVFSFMGVAVDALYASGSYDFHGILEIHSATSRAYNKLVDTIHGALGTENLSDEVRQHFGKAKVSLLSVDESKTEQEKDG